MAIPQVDKRMLGELEAMGFPTVRSTRALHFSGNSNLESAINWLLEHESDPVIDQLPLIPREISIECGDTSNEVRNNMQGTRAHAQERKPEESTATGRQKERIQAAKELMEAKRTLEENQRKRMMESRKADQEEEKRARERIRQRIEDDKGERRGRLGLPKENPGASVAIITPTKIRPVEPVVTSEQLRDCLRNQRKNYKDDSARVRRAFQILLKIVANIAKNPEEEKFRRIRLSNPVFKDKVGSLQGGVEFLELCGFEKLRASGYLVMPRGKVDMALLNVAGVEIASAMENPYFGLLSK